MFRVLVFFAKIDGDAGGFDRKDLCDLFSFKLTLQFFPDLLQERNIDLVVQERVDLEDVAFFDLTVFSDPVLKKLHLHKHLDFCRGGLVMFF